MGTNLPAHGWRGDLEGPSQAPWATLDCYGARLDQGFEKLKTAQLAKSPGKGTGLVDAQDLAHGSQELPEMDGPRSNPVSIQ